MSFIAEIAGVIGVAAITAAYFLLSAGKIRSDHWSYPFVNFVGAVAIVWSLTFEWNLSAFLMESSWALISLYGWAKTWRKKIQ